MHYNGRRFVYTTMYNFKNLSKWKNDKEESYSKTNLNGSRLKLEPEPIRKWIAAPSLTLRQQLFLETRQTQNQIYFWTVFSKCYRFFSDKQHNADLCSDKHNIFFYEPSCYEQLLECLDSISLFLTRVCRVLKWR